MADRVIDSDKYMAINANNTFKNVFALYALSYAHNACTLYISYYAYVHWI